jgi:NADH:ubiquinone oxidoreductase subunit 6 (subunit J)
MSAQDAFWNWLLPWIVIGLGLLTAIVIAIMIALVRTKRRESD